MVKELPVLKGLNHQKIEIKNGKYHYHYLIYQFTKRNSRVGLIDCGSRFNPYLISNAARFENLNSEELLKQVKIVRAFTVFQLKTALEKTLRENPDVVIISDVDAVLKDPGIPEVERENTFISLLSKIHRIKTPVFIVGENFMLTNISMDN
ncbi:hypothetical protein [Persephonella sp.]